MTKDVPVQSISSVKVDLQLLIFQEGDAWIAYCPALDLSSYGDDEADAKQAFEEAMKIFLDETARKGTLERYLLKLGWQLQLKPKPVYNQPAVSLTKNQQILRKNPRFLNERVAIPIILN